MKFSMVVAISLGVLAASARADEKAAPKAAAPDSKDVRQKASYGYGWLFGKQLVNQKMDFDSEIFIQGLKDAFAKKPGQYSDAEIEEAMRAHNQEIVEKKAKEGEVFLAENKKKPDVKTLPSGLQYKVIKQGTGKTPKATDTVSVNYTGRLVDNSVFDSSANSGGPASFEVGKVIPGFAEALQLMTPGSKWEIYIPSKLAYGANPRPGGPIGPNAALIFEVELLNVK